jgi:hypothetical protein
VWQAQQLKLLSHAVRASSLRSYHEGQLPAIRKDVVVALMVLARKDARAGFAFSRLSRALPRPPKVAVEKALAEHRKMLTSKGTTSEWILRDLQTFVTEAIRPRVRHRRFPVSLPSSSSSCFENSASRGGIDGFLYRVGLATEGLALLGFWTPEFGDEFPELTLEELAPFTRDSLGQYCRTRCDNLDRAMSDPGSEDGSEAIRCYGVLGLRAHRARNGLGPRARASAIASPGMKVRVVGVPDALTFIEGDWIRRSLFLLPKEHWPAQRMPRSLARRRGEAGTFFSLDLSKATDGLHHDAVRAVIQGLRGAGSLRRDGEYDLALASLGLEPATIWDYGKGSQVVARRGSPMGTPLSFPVLSLINAWATRCFKATVVHGDDAVGFASPVKRLDGTWSGPTDALDEYELAITSVGGELNRGKTYTSQSSWTACETLARKTHGGKERNGWDFFIPPPCPAPGLAAPVCAEGRTRREFMNRQERVMKTLFPYCARDPRLHLPVEVGGLGYVGRGLRCGRRLRARLGTLVSKGTSYLVSRRLCTKAPFRAEGLYPRPLVPAPKDKMRGYYAIEKQFPKVEELQSSSGVSVPVSDLVAYRERLVYREYRLMCGYEDRRRRDGGRPEWTKRSAVFKAMTAGPYAAPLSVRYGVRSLVAFAERCKSLRVTVDPTVASRIPGRTRDPVAELELGYRNAQDSPRALRAE